MQLLTRVLDGMRTPDRAVPQGDDIARALEAGPWAAVKPARGRAPIRIAATYPGETP